MSFLAHPVVYFLLYILLMIPTYFLPYFGSNSPIFGVASVAAGRGVYPLFLLHLGFLSALIVLVWIRGARIQSRWLTVFPALALVFDLAPGLNWIPMIPTTMHLLAIIIGVVKGPPSAAPAEGHAHVRGPGGEANYEKIQQDTRSSTVNEIAARQETGDGLVDSNFAGRANLRSVGEWAKLAGLVSVALVFLLVLFKFFDPFKVQRPDPGGSQVAVSPKPPVPAISPPVASTPPIASMPPVVSTSPVAVAPATTRPAVVAPPVSNAPPVGNTPPVSLGDRQEARVQPPSTLERARYKLTSCLSIVDRTTQLEWYVGSDLNTTSSEAVKWVRELGACGGKWTMPGTNQLRTLFNPEQSAGTGYYTRGRYWPAHIDPIFSQIGKGSWVWAGGIPDSRGAPAFNFNQGIGVRLSPTNGEYTVRAFAVRHASE